MSVWSFLWSPILPSNLSNEQWTKAIGKRLWVCKFCLHLVTSEIPYWYTLGITDFFKKLDFLSACMVDNASSSHAIPQVRKSCILPLLGIQATSLPWNFSSLVDSIQAMTVDNSSLFYCWGRNNAHVAFPNLGRSQAVLLTITLICPPKARN